ncbi:hypothetical protein CI105_01210 [Candidatus Izimaplasma bacterium ZiA1]|uniref:extracellular solute-binding protein n=1 Tax=Candidatus Izimoplasma sp. ZiA1 TaxID=2024899 RepID=UPI000BAA79E5|nr:hypothetical protein CI105_01210 [Candidatus Izimaplasma bacterium ZiA1]
MKKLFLAALSVLAVMTLAACGGGSSNSNEVNVLDTLPDETINITFWHTYGQSKGELLDAQIAAFELLYPNIKVEAISQESYDGLKDKTTLAIPAGNAPTMLVGYPDHVAEYMLGDAVIPLDKFIEHTTWGVDLSDFIPAYVEENRQYADGLMYSLPYSKSTEFLVYNKTVMDANNITIPNDRALTYAELETIAATVVGNGENQCEYLINYDSPANLFINITRQYDGGYTDIDGNILVNNANTKLGLNYFLGLFQDKTVVLPSAWEGEDYGSVPFKKAWTCMSVGSTAGVKYNMPSQKEIDESDYPNDYLQGVFEVGFAPVPQLENGINSATQQGPNIAILSDSTDAERLAAWLLIKHLTNVENTVDWSMETGYLPVRTSAINSDEYQTFLTNPEEYQANASAAINAALVQTPYFKYDPAFALRTSSASARRQAEIALVAIYLETKTVDQAVQAMIDQLTW